MSEIEILVGVFFGLGLGYVQSSYMTPFVWVVGWMYAPKIVSFLFGG